MRIQLWSYNYEPEPSGIAPLSAALARGLQARGHQVAVVAAHPHYPKPLWGRCLHPYRERRDGVPVLRLPLWVGRRSGAERIRQELSYATLLSAAAPLLGPADVIVAVSPSFPALLPAMGAAIARRTPWVMWLQDILPDGAAATGLVEDGALLAAARTLERSAYASARRVVVISDAFRRNLIAKGVAPDKIVRIYNPSPAEIAPVRPRPPARSPEQLLVMGNIGFSQGLDAIVESLQRSGVLAQTDAQLRIAGSGVAEDKVRAAITRVDDGRIEMLGLLFGRDLEDELERAAVGLVTQRAGLSEFNLPSKLMNYLAHGLPVIAVVNPVSETAHLVRDTGAGWVVDASRPDELEAAIRAALTDRDELARRAAAAHRAAARFSPEHVAEQFESVLASAVGLPALKSRVVPASRLAPKPAQQGLAGPVR